MLFGEAAHLPVDRGDTALQLRYAPFAIIDVPLGRPSVVRGPPLLVQLAKPGAAIDRAEVSIGLSPNPGITPVVRGPAIFSGVNDPARYSLLEREEGPQSDNIVEEAPYLDAALQMFLTAIRRIGKGTGKSASRLRRDARDAMETSYAAVPCWIMPSWRISESLPATLASFDLVIFDEASQSDIAALPALLRAKKVLIVGDDKQVSPTAAFIEEQRLRSLRMHYLDGQPFGALLLPGNSLYELALACYPGRRIMLREHFRCVEPIIRFSFQFYTDEIVPVRVPKASERLSPPLIDVHVVEGRKDRSNRNLAEAEAIVEEIARIVADPAMASRTIGVISLIGAKQAQLIQAMLLERIGEDAYVRHDIACGDSAVFQGKERDIVLLSMVECPQTCTSKTALPLPAAFQRRALPRPRSRVSIPIGH